MTLALAVNSLSETSALAISPSIALSPSSEARSARVLMCGELPVSTQLVSEGMAESAVLERFIKSMFRKVHQAEVTHFMPTFLTLRDQQYTLRAVCGLRHADQEPLFLERYFTRAIEDVLSEKAGIGVARSEILEVGNLAILEPACIRSLLASVSTYLHSTEANWAVFTGLPTLKNALLRLRIPLITLGDATPQALSPDEREAWGHYYDQRPVVMAVKRLSHNQAL